MVRVAQLVFIALMLSLHAVASADPAEEANATVDRWSVAYSSNDPENIAKTYWPDAILLGTVSPIISEGSEAIVTYFTPTKGTGNKNAIDERRTIHGESRWDRDRFAVDQQVPAAGRDRIGYVVVQVKLKDQLFLS